MPHPVQIDGKFDQDPRVAFDKVAGKFQYEDESGQEFEWVEVGKTWIPLVDESDWKAQQAAYSVPGVDEETPANAVVAREEKRNKKKKKDVDYTSNTSSRSTTMTTNATASSSTTPSTSTSTNTKPTLGPSAPKKTAVYVTNLPPNTTPTLLSSVFSKAGVLLLGDDNQPRIKLYNDDSGNFKGEALIMYFKEGSVDLAITLLDDTELELGAGFGNMRVKVAEYDKSGGNVEAKKKKEEGVEKKVVEGDDKGEVVREKKRPSAEDKQRMSKRIRTMEEKLAWRSDDDEDDPLAPIDGAPKPGSSRAMRVVVLKGMFSKEAIDKDPSLLVELKEDVREEAETLGQVTSIILYDKEEDGVMTIKFKDALSAQACVTKMHGRYFDGRMISASIYTGKERFQRSGAGVLDDEDERGEEKQRLDNFASWLVDGEEGD